MIFRFEDPLVHVGERILARVSLCGKVLAVDQPCQVIAQVTREAYEAERQELGYPTKPHTPESRYWDLSFD